MPILMYRTCRAQNNSLTSYILLLQSLSAHTFPLRLISTKGNFSLLSLSATPISNVNQKRITLMRYQKGHIQFKWVSRHFRSCSGHWVNVWLSLRTNGLLFQNILKTIHFFYSFLHLQLNCQYFMVAENLLPLRPLFCWMLMHKIFKPEGFCKMVKRVHMHFGTTMHSSLHMQSYLRNHSCRFQMISQFNLGKNLSWTQLILPAEMHAISNSKQVALEEYYCLKGLQILT